MSNAQLIGGKIIMVGKIMLNILFVMWAAYNIKLSKGEDRNHHNI
jgi:hypothetical protein